MSGRLTRRLAVCVALGAAVGLVTWLAGMDAGHALGLAGAVAAVGCCVAMLGDRGAVAWPPEPPTPREGLRRDVAQLGWAVQTRRGIAAPEAVRRLRSVAGQALALHGHDLDDPAQRPAVEAMLGADGMAILRRGGAETPRTGVFEAILARLERLAGQPRSDQQFTREHEPRGGRL